MSRLVKALIPLGLFGGLCIFLAVGLTRDPNILPSELIDREFPDFELSRLYAESDLVTHDILQDEITLVNVFGSWCVACLQEHPMLMELQRQGDIPIVGINWRDKREAGIRWLERYGDPYDEIIFDPYSALAIELGISGAPESFIVDKNGRVRYKYVGVITPEVWRNEFRPVIAALEEEAP